MDVCMFGKNLGNELKQYLRHLWPFAIAVVATAAIACAVSVHNDYPHKLNYYLAALSIFIMAVCALIVRGVVHSYVSFAKIDKSVKEENVSVSAYWAQFLAFTIFMIGSALFALLGVTLFAHNTVWKIFSSFSVNWPYYIEFIFYYIILACNVYLIPTTWIAVFRFNKQKKWPRVLSLIVGIAILIASLATLYLEAPLLANMPSSDAQTLTSIVIFFLAVFLIADIGMFVLTRFTLKKHFASINQTDAQQPSV